MNMLKASLAVIALCGFGSVASAKAFPGGGGPLPSVRKQIFGEAKSDGILKNLTQPSLRLKYAENGKTVTATVLSMSTFFGPPRIGIVRARRMQQFQATFKIGQLTEGKVATPEKHYGQVWSGFVRALDVK